MLPNKTCHAASDPFFSKLGTRVHRDEMGRNPVYRKYFQFLTRLATFQTKDYELRDDVMKKLFTTSSTNPHGSSSTQRFGDKIICANLAPNSPTTPASSTDQDAIAYRFYRGVYVPLAVAEKGNFVYMGMHPFFHDMFKLTQTGKKTALTIARQFACDPCTAKVECTYMKLDGEFAVKGVGVSYYTWEEFEKECTAAKAAGRELNADIVHHFVNAVKVNVFAMQWAKNVVAPNEPIVSHIRGRIHAAVRTFTEDPFEVKKIIGFDDVKAAFKTFKDLVESSEQIYPLDPKQLLAQLNPGATTGVSYSDLGEVVGPLANSIFKVYGYFQQRQSENHIKHVVALEKTLKQNSKKCDMKSLLSRATRKHGFETLTEKLIRCEPVVDIATVSVNKVWRHGMCVHVEAVEDGCASVTKIGQKTPVKVPNIRLKMALIDNRSTTTSTITGYNPSEKQLMFVDLTKYTDCLNLFYRTPKECLDAKLNEISLTLKELNNENMSSSGLQLGCRVPVRSRFLVWVTLLDSQRIRWLVDTKDGGIYVISKSWRLSTTPQKKHSATVPQKLTDVNDLHYARAQGFIPPPWCGVNFLYNIREALRNLMRGEFVDKLSCGDDKTRSVVIDPSSGSAYVDKTGISMRFK